MLRKRIQIGLIHVAVAITLVPINSTLNRVMIKELAISATVVGLLAAVPYLFSPIQLAIGSFSDRNPLFGYRRTPYILSGLLLCVLGVSVSPTLAYNMADGGLGPMLVGMLAFGLWGMGYNVATVAYFSLATEVSGEKGRSRTIAVMFFMMIVGIIITSISLSALLEVYNPERLISAFRTIGLVALALGLLGVIGLEARHKDEPLPAASGEEDFSWRMIWAAFVKNKQALRFFIYLVLLLTAILGQDILLEPYGAEAFGMSVQTTTRITSIWGIFFLIALALGGAVERRVPKLVQARMGAWSGIAAFALIVMSGLMANASIFYLGVMLLGAATGLSTVSNLSLMLDMTTVGSVGLFIGAWGMASAASRLIGNLLSGMVRDGVSLLSGDAIMGYVVVFIIEIVMLVVSLLILRKVDVNLFQAQAEENLPYVDRAALAGEGS